MMGNTEGVLSEIWKNITSEADLFIARIVVFSWLGAAQEADKEHLIFPRGSAESTWIYTNQQMESIVEMDPPAALKLAFDLTKLKSEDETKNWPRRWAAGNGLYILSHPNMGELVRESASLHPTDETFRNIKKWITIDTHNWDLRKAHTTPEYYCKVQALDLTRHFISYPISGVGADLYKLAQVELSDNEVVQQIIDYYGPFKDTDSLVERLKPRFRYG